MTKVEAIIYFDPDLEKQWISQLKQVIDESVKNTTGHQRLGIPRSPRKKSVSS